MALLMDNSEVTLEMLQRISQRVYKAAGDEATKQKVGVMTIVFSADGAFFVSSAVADANVNVGLLMRAAMIQHNAAVIIPAGEKASIDVIGN